jgi:hypothetical protein
MAGRKTIVSFFVILLTACFCITSTAFAEEGQQKDEYAPGFYYTVQKGDTLWGLSKKFYDSEWEWPAMWGQNEQLTNPHMIYPGQRIRLYQRTDTIAAPEAEAGEAEGVAPGPESQAAAQAASGEEALPAKTIHYYYPGIAYIDFIKKLPPPTGIINKSVDDPLVAGAIIKAQGEKKTMISQNDTVYIRPMTGNFIVGDLYSVYRPLIKIYDPDTDAYVGHQYRIIATAEIMAVEPKFVTAKITKELDTINSECFVMPQQKRSPEIPIQPAAPGLKGKILLSESHIEMSSDYSIVFLDKGEKDGVRVGQRYDIYLQDKYERNDQQVMLSQFVYGKLLVLVTEHTTATAIVTKSTRPIRKGALFKSPL